MHNTQIRTKSWWETTPIEDFPQAISTLGDHALEVLFFELKLPVSNCASRAANTQLDPVARRKARAALRYLSGKRNLVKLELVRRGLAGARAQ